MYASSLNNSSSTLVERLRAPRCGSPIDLAPELDDLCQEAAALISELQADIAKLGDPVAVHLNMLRGGIAKPSWANILHLYPEEATRHPSFNDAIEAWQPIESAPKSWIIGYTSWGQHVGKFHEHVGPCEYIDFRDRHEFTNTDFDAFPSPTHWMPWPKPRSLKLPDYRGGEKIDSAKTAEG